MPWGYTDGTRLVCTDVCCCGQRDQNKPISQPQSLLHKLEQLAVRPKVARPVVKQSSGSLDVQGPWVLCESGRGGLDFLLCGEGTS